MSNLPTKESADLIRLLLQRHMDEGDSLARNAAWHIEDLERRLAPEPSGWPTELEAAKRVGAMALGAAGQHAERVLELEAEVSTLRESLAEVNRLLSLNVAEVARLQTLAPAETPAQRKARQVLQNAFTLRDHFTYCDRTMGDSHGCTCGMDAYAKRLRQLDQQPETKPAVRTDCYGAELGPISESDGAIYSAPSQDGCRE